MIVDTLANAEKYVGLHKNFQKAFEFIRSKDWNAVEPGKFQIQGDELHAAVSLKDGYKTNDAKFEAHNHYIDIQVCPAGSEKIGWRPLKDCKNPKTAYDPEKDVTFYNDQPETYFDLHEGQFAIFFPEDVHAPMIGEGKIKKLVVKVKL